MEKSKSLAQSESQLPAPRPPRRSLSPLVSTLLFVAAVVRIGFYVSSPLTPAATAPKLGNGDVVSPTIGKLYPTDCWEDFIKPPFTCYTFYTPLDYSNTSDSRLAKLAVIKYPAGGKDGSNKKKKKGTMLLNPGGPGGRGVPFLSVPSARVNNLTLADATDKLMGGTYDLVSWDPRGVGLSYPLANCYKTEAQQAGGCNCPEPRETSSGPTCNLQCGRYNGKLCSENATLADELRFVSTSDTANDMRLLYQAMGDTHLHYWGFSYGTVLGSVFADMFPEQIGRMVIDGVVDVPNYMAGNWSDNVWDMQKLYEDGLLGECEKAGKKCPLNEAAKGRNLKDVMSDFFTQLIAEPIISIDTDTSLLTYSGFKEPLFTSLYTTYGWPKLLNLTAQILRGNPTSFISNYLDGSDNASTSPFAQDAIMGGDALMRTKSWTLQDYLAHITEQEQYSLLFGQDWAGNKNSIETWQITAKNRWFGNYTANTRRPILIVGNDLDPATPYHGAEAMAMSFPNSNLLRLKMYGHCSTAQPSKCAMQTIADYFVNGTVPERILGKDGKVIAGKVCDVDHQPWDNITAPATIKQGRADTYRFDLIHMEAISEAIHHSRHQARRPR